MSDPRDRIETLRKFDVTKFFGELIDEYMVNAIEPPRMRLLLNMLFGYLGSGCKGVEPDRLDQTLLGLSLMSDLTSMKVHAFLEKFLKDGAAHYGIAMKMTAEEVLNDWTNQPAAAVSASLVEVDNNSIAAKFEENGKPVLLVLHRIDDPDEIAAFEHEHAKPETHPLGDVELIKS